jgi:vitamin B12 transporter
MPSDLTAFAAVTVLLLLPSGGVASDEAPASREPGLERTALAMDTTEAELRMFWEGKDLYVQSATRTVKPISRVAENVTVVTAKDIEDMNAHTLLEVLQRVTGVFVSWQGMDFGGEGLLHIQGSSETHVTVLLDGVPWNLTGRNAVTSTIPVRIVDRIEIVKGPASSAWGSALGGVVNIITKSAGDTALPRGALRGTYGQAASTDDSVELHGKGGPVGYYLFAGRQESRGLRFARAYDRDSAYAKAQLAVSRDVDVEVAVGYGNASHDAGRGGPAFPGFVATSGSAVGRAFFAAASLEDRITDALTLRASLYTLRQRFAITTNSADGAEFVQARDDDDTRTGASLKLAYARGMHTAALGADLVDAKLEEHAAVGPAFQAVGLAADRSASPREATRALFANDTIVFAPFSVTPGVRIDYSDVSGTFVSPSLGATCRLGERAIARASAARGFTRPDLGLSAGLGGILIPPNPSLRPEGVWSFQGGLESALAEYLWLKGTGYYHDMNDEIVFQRVLEPTPHREVRNDGHVTRYGFELEAETAPLHNVSLRAGSAYVRRRAGSEQPSTTDDYAFLVGAKYDDRSLMAQIAGTYVWWDIAPEDGARSQFIWDLNVRYRVRLSAGTTADVFLAVHNLFDGSYYSLLVFPNPRRWVEGGMAFKF